MEMMVKQGSLNKVETDGGHRGMEIKKGRIRESSNISGAVKSRGKNTIKEEEGKK